MEIVAGVFSETSKVTSFSLIQKLLTHIERITVQQASTEKPHATPEKVVLSSTKTTLCH